MAMTQADWYTKLRSFVPSWWFEREEYQNALFQALAAVLAEVDLEADNYLGETFLLTSTAPALDAHGDERNVTRLSGESDSSYANRVRNIVNRSNLLSIEDIVNGILPVGTCEIREHESTGLFLSRDSYFNRKEVYSNIFYNAFSVVVSNQGTGASIDAVMQSIATAINTAKALGVLYRITETLT